MSTTAYKQEQGSRFSPALCVRCPYQFKEQVKALGGIWNPMRQCWELPYTLEDWQNILLSIPGIQPVAIILEELGAPQAAEEAPAPRVRPMPLKEGITPFNHQKAAYSHAIALFEGVV